MEWRDKQELVDNMGAEQASSVTYSSNDSFMMVEEHPYYRAGMSKAEAQKELEYLNQHMDAFYEGKYMPLWRQGWFR